MLAAAFALVLSCGVQDRPAPAQPETARGAAGPASAAMVIEVEFSPALAENAAKRAAGDAGMPPPVLKLEGLEVDPRQSLELEIRGPRDPAKGEGPLLATTGLVGAPSDPAAPASQTHDLLIPLTGEVGRLLAEARQAGRTRLTLEIVAEGQPLRYRRIYFDAAPPP